ncbi:TIGR02302 family protein OS=Afipia felis OX=1035 GN=NCTC12722_00830 PE=4 SV=1 [Afipia felis]
MSGQTPESPQTPPSEEDVLLKAIARAVQRAQLAIAWERLWPSLARALTVAGLFLAASWAGAWTWVPFALRVAGVAAFAVAGIAALAPLVRFRWPDREEALRRLDLDSGIAHRPATALTDTLNSDDPVARALWSAQRTRMRASLDRIRARLPSPDLPRHDPLAIRAAAILLLIATFIAAGDERTVRLRQAFDWNGVLSGAPARVDAWIDPPPYTNRPPVVISGAQKAASSEGPISVPVGSTLIVRASGGSLDVSLSGSITAVADAGTKPQGTDERHFTIAGDGSARVRSPSSLPQWSFTAIPDHAPTIALAKEPERQAHGGLSLSYKLEDDYGVTQAQAHIALRDDGADGSAEKATSPLYDPIEFALGLPNARTKSGVGQTVKDLSAHPYAGADVTLTLTAKDEAGNEGRSEPFHMRLPQRVFNKPLARALIEQRRLLALDASQKPLVMIALEALLIAPQAFMPESGQYLGLRAVAEQLTHANTREALRGTVDSLWALAVAIEDKDVTDVEKALRAAQDALKQALERGASDEEIKKLTQDLRAALSDYLRQLAQQLQKNPQELARPLDRNARVMSEQDLKAMIDRMERLARSGDKEAAQQLLEQMQQMLENLQMAQPGQGDQEMQQALNELGDIARKQQQLRDKTYREGQNSRDAENDRSAMSDLQREQQGLRDRLQKLLEGMKQKGMMPQQGGKQPGEDGELSEGNPLGDADNAMGEADGRLGEGRAGGAVDAQGRAVEALKKGAQNLAQQNQGEGDGQGNRFGRRQSGGQETDPLGRPLKSRDYSDNSSVKIPGEIDVQRVRRILEELRRRLGDNDRPQIELDYIERLLKDY